MNEKIYNEDGITVEELINMLQKCPPKAKVLLNHYCKIDFEDDETGKLTKHKAWIFDEILEAQCEGFEGCEERYPYYQSEGKIVWLTHQSSKED